MKFNSLGIMRIRMPAIKESRELWMVDRVIGKLLSCFNLLKGAGEENQVSSLFLA